MDLSIFKIGGWSSLQPTNQNLLEEFVDENELRLLNGIPSKDPFFVTQYFMEMHFERWVRWYGRKTNPSSVHRRQHVQFLCEQISEVNRNQYCEQISAAGKRVWQSTALSSPTKTLNTDLAPIDDNTEPIGAPRADAEMWNDENEELLGKRRVPGQE